jgi:ubiquitin-activating enzyme E1
MNPSLQLEPQTYRLHESTRNIYDDAFYESLSGVCNALDNVPARLFSDSMCVLYRKPLLESGTLGPKANFQVVVPFLTESYGSLSDPEEETIPACTLHHTPSNIHHCCMWARDQFAYFFEQTPSRLAKFLSTGSFAEIDTLPPLTAAETLQTMVTSISERPRTPADCARWARRIFEDSFVNRIHDLLYMFPLDHVVDGRLFWTGSHRPPTALVFDLTDPSHAALIRAGSAIWARIWGVETPGPDAVEVAAAVEPQVWKPTIGAEVLSEDETAARIAKLKEELTRLREENCGLTVTAEEFEKDVDANGHIDWIAAVSNLRARNYRIKEEDRLEIKRIAGKIIPALATTTAMVCGFVSLELYKIHAIEPKKMGDFRSGFINLGISLFAISEPGRAPETTIATTGEKFSPLWHREVVPAEVATIGNFVEWVEKRFAVSASSVRYGQKLIWAGFGEGVEERAAMGFKQAFEAGTGEELPEGRKELVVSVAAADPETFDDVDLPTFVVNLTT